MFEFLRKYTSWKFFLVLLGLFFLSNILFVILAPTGTTNAIPLDLRFSYSAEDVYLLFSQLGPETLKRYAVTALTVDIFYPIVYALMLAFLLLKVSQNTNLAIFPFAAFVFDCIENICIAILVYLYPEEWTFLASMTSVFTSLKWLSIGVNVVLLVVLFVRRVLKQRGT